MRKFILLIGLVFFSGAAAAQTIETFRVQLAERDASGGRIKVTERGDAAQIIRTFNPGDPDRKVKGYRVVIFFDNSHNARQGGDAALARFKELYPDVSARMSYENPHFKVTAGNCLTLEEAMILWGRIKNVFEKAFITREEIPLSFFGLQI